MVLANSNVGSNVTTICDKNGNLLIKFSREYGEIVPTHEVIEVEKALLALSEQLFAKLEK